MEECVEKFDYKRYMARKNELKEAGEWFPRWGGIMNLEFGSHVEKIRYKKMIYG